MAFRSSVSHSPEEVVRAAVASWYRAATAGFEINPARLHGPRWRLDVAGHSGRPDVFRFAVDRRPRPASADVTERWI